MVSELSNHYMMLQRKLESGLCWDQVRYLQLLLANDANRGYLLGPYINAETTAGGIAHWITTEIAGTLRTTDEDWHEAWIPYLQGITDETAPYQITNGGPVIGVFFSSIQFNQSLSAASSYPSWYVIRP